MGKFILLPAALRPGTFTVFLGPLSVVHGAYWRARTLLFSNHAGSRQNGPCIAAAFSYHSSCYWGSVVQTIAPCFYFHGLFIAVPTLLPIGWWQLSANSQDRLGALVQLSSLCLVFLGLEQHHPSLPNLLQLRGRGHIKKMILCQELAVHRQHQMWHGFSLKALIRVNLDRSSLHSSDKYTWIRC